MSSSTIQCSNCGRPGSLQRTHCMYCGHELKHPVTSSSPDVTELVPKDLDYVSWIPAKEADISVYTGPFPPLAQRKPQKKEWDPTLLSHLQQMSGDVVFAIDQKLRGERPFPLLGALSVNEAQTLLKQLQYRNYPAVAISQTELKSAPQALLVQRLTKDGNRWQCWMENGDLLTLDWNDLFLAVVGKLQEEHKHNIERTKVVRQGRSYRVETERDTKKQHNDELVLQLYRWSAFQGLQISFQKTEMSDFWDPLRESLLTVGNKLMEIIHQKAPQSFWDKGFTGAMTSVEEVTLQHRMQHQQNHRPYNSVSQESKNNREAFRQYAALVHLYYRRLWNTSGHSEWPPEGTLQVEIESEKPSGPEEHYTLPSFTIS